LRAASEVGGAVAAVGPVTVDVGLPLLEHDNAASSAKAHHRVDLRCFRFLCGWERWTVGSNWVNAFTLISFAGNDAHHCATRVKTHAEGNKEEPRTRAGAQVSLRPIPEISSVSTAGYSH
jgi:hypothetical protein